jgi:hypothetical protein
MDWLQRFVDQTLEEMQALEAEIEVEVIETTAGESLDETGDVAAEASGEPECDEDLKDRTAKPRKR